MCETAHSDQINSQLKADRFSVRELRTEVLPLTSLTRKPNVDGMGNTGFDLPRNPKKTAIFDSGGAKSGALGANLAPIDAELAEVVEAWDTLPEAVRAGILAMVSAATS